MCAFVSPTSRSTGDVITAAIWNQDVVNNQLAGALQVFTSAGDLFVGTGSKAGARLARGSALQQLRTNPGGTAIEWASPTGSQLVTQNNTEVTRNVASWATAFALSGFSIPATQPLLIHLNVRKTIGAASAPQIAVQLNGAAWISDGTAACMSNVDQAEQGSIEIYIPPRVTSYLRSGWMRSITHADSSSVATQFLASPDANAPTANITTIDVRFNPISASITVGFDECRLYNLPTS